MWPFAKKTLPSNDPEEWLWSIREQMKFTPDIHQLEERETWFYFAYDETQRGHLQEKLLLSGAIMPFGNPQCTAFTKQKFTVFKKNLGKATFPIPVGERYAKSGLFSKMSWMEPYAPIQGELYLAAPSKLIELDKYKENGVKFVRVRTKVLLPYRDVHFVKDRDQLAEFLGIPLNTALVPNPYEKIVEVPAWMYVAIPRYWNKHIDAGYEFSSLQLLYPKDPLPFDKFYHFAKSECF